MVKKKPTTNVKKTVVENKKTELEVAGAKIKYLYPSKITIELVGGEKLVVESSSCRVSTVVGFEEMGVTFQIQGRVTQGKIVF